jgi:hypothetical protein
MAIFAHKKFVMTFMLFSILMLCVHFVFVVAYSFRDQLPNQATPLVDRYVVPMFHQNWKLFAPDLPKNDTQLEYRYYREGGWYDWVDITAECGHGRFSRMETIEQGFNTQLSWQIINNFYAKDGRAQFDRIIQSPSYASALFYTLKMHQLHIDPVQPDSIQIRSVFRFTPPPDQAHSYQYSMLEFPAYSPALK